MEPSQSLIWKTLKENQPEYLSTLDPDFFCPVCSSLLTDPYNTPCGHNFCLSCLSKILESETKTCPLDKESFVGIQQIKNKFLQKKVLQITLKCPNSTEGCKWQGPAAELCDHFKECSEGTILCHFGCGKQIKKKVFESHLKENAHFHLNALYEENQILKKKLENLEEKVERKMEKLENFEEKVERKMEKFQNLLNETVQDNNDKLQKG